MYGVNFSLWLTGAVGPQAVAGRHSSTRPLASGRLGAGIVSDTTNYHHTGPLYCIGELLENSKTWLSIIICSLML